MAYLENFDSLISTQKIISGENILNPTSIRLDPRSNRCKNVRQCQISVAPEMRVCRIKIEETRGVNKFFISRVDATCFLFQYQQQILLFHWDVM